MNALVVCFLFYLLSVVLCRRLVIWVTKKEAEEIGPVHLVICLIPAINTLFLIIASLFYPAIFLIERFPDLGKKASRAFFGAKNVK